MDEEAQVLAQTEATPTPMATPEDENDCVIVATKHLHDLGDSVPWKQMLMFVYVIDGKREAIGHAVAVFLDNNVFVSGAYGPTLPAGWSLVAQ
jgi:hypothetical protein